MIEKIIKNGNNKNSTDRSGQRERKIIIHRAPESTETRNKTRKEEDQRLFQEVCKIMDVEAEPERIYRLGPPREDKVRPLKVIFKGVDEKIEFKRKLKELRNAEEPYNSLSVMDGMTQEEREENKYLVMKAKKLTEEDETCLLYTSPSPRDGLLTRMPSSA